MPMQYHYMPVLKGKMGEFRALECVGDEQRALFTPLIEVPPIPWDYDEDVDAKSLEDHLSKLPEKIRSSWNTVDPICLDLDVALESSAANRGRIATKLVEECVANGLKVVIAAGLHLGDDSLEVVARCADMAKQGILVRLVKVDFDRPDLTDRIVGIVERVNLAPQDCDLMVDLKDIGSVEVGIYAMAARGMLESVPRITEWRNFLLSSGAFPQDLSGFERNRISRWDRGDWKLWNRVRTLPGIQRKPVYSDYTIASHEMVAIDPRMMNPSASIRYTADGAWLVVKGGGVRGSGGFDQFHELAQQLMGEPEYGPEEFCWADGKIARIARREENSGNLTTWRQVGTNRHINVVIRQLANLAAP